MGLSIPLWYLYLIDAFVVIVVALPVSIFGIGTRELSYVFLLAPFSVSFSQAITFSLLVMFLNTLIGLPGLFFYLSRTFQNTPSLCVRDE